jgi:hypothetical protein
VTSYRTASRLAILTSVALTAITAIAIDRATRSRRGATPDPRAAQEPLGTVLDAEGRVLVRGPLSAREYVFGSAFAPTVGVVARGGRGAGLERRALEWLSQPAHTIPPSYLDRDGDARLSLRVTLETPLQLAAVDALRRTRRQGSIVIVDAATGAIVVSATYPSYDPAAFRRDPAAVEAEASVWDPALSARLAAGSTFKLWTALAILRRGGSARPFQCDGHVALGAGRPDLHCTRPHGLVASLDAAFSQSCNTYFASAAAADGGRGLMDAIRAGLGSASIAIPPDPFEAGLAGIGQGKVAVSPLAQAASLAALYSDADGTFSARLVLEGPEHMRAPLVQIPLLPREERAQLRKLLDHAATGVRARMDGAAATVVRGAKTGTAERGSTHVAWLVGALRLPRNDGAPARTLGFAIAVLDVDALSIEVTPQVLSALLEAHAHAR